MKLLLLPLLMAVFASCQVYGEESSPREDADFWASSNQIQDGWISNPYPFREILMRMTRKPRPHQFIGLMGKRSMETTGGAIEPSYTSDLRRSERTHTANAQITHKRHKINSFVGLMGKRSEEEPDSYEWSTIHSYDKRR